MKRFHKMIAISIVAVLLLLMVSTHFIAATIFTQDGFYYSRSSSTTADLYGRESTDADLVIPKALSGYYITNIEDSAFSGDQDITSLSFSSAILLERIGYYAFEDCTNLSGTVYITGRINNIGIAAFQNCSSLEEVRYMGNGVKVISAQCFYNCSSLSFVQLPSRLTTIEKLAFANTALTEITIPDSVTSIDSSAFSGCDNLTIYCNTGSYAQQFAEENGIEYVLLDAPEPTEPPTEAPTDAPTEEPTDAPTEAPTDAPTEAPTDTPTEQPTTPKTYILGDVDGDGIISTMDATWIQRYEAQMNIPAYITINHGDVNNDDIVDVLDATWILRKNVYFPVPYPIGEEVTE